MFAVGSNAAQVGWERSSLSSPLCPTPTSSPQLLRAPAGDPASLQELNSTPAEKRSSQMSAFPLEAIFQAAVDRKSMLLTASSISTGVLFPSGDALRPGISRRFTKSSRVQRLGLQPGSKETRLCFLHLSLSTSVGTSAT